MHVEILIGITILGMFLAFILGIIAGVNIAKIIIGHHPAPGESWIRPSWPAIRKILGQDWRRIRLDGKRVFD